MEEADIPPSGRREGPPIPSAKLPTMSVGDVVDMEIAEILNPGPAHVPISARHAELLREGEYNAPIPAVCPLY